MTRLLSLLALLAVTTPAFALFAMTVPVEDARREAIAAEDRGDQSQALAIWRSLADKGDDEAEYQLGQHLTRGPASTAERIEGAHWLTRAASRGHQGALDALSALAAGTAPVTLSARR
ncbi:hypothetical protein [Rhodospirillum rubrum]|uniref:Sel1 repeat family protein n=1 Tax=Rhodospirillum rubrum (strain ATCC 11170 / ATH 1.1.1 / DSM 467 / LMG 4362 / NCIMB 8255 / S1) TaxID=269796 RepID=Q2RNK6_RHORT|nr:hypothetical protein [Rhodospirillum rubrum]ABC24289.1 hypothetical protein Rru_A3495 [Rhodospirillum rubrum ATCC 11170]AEO50040.1 hypothetical protein F11_17900 [Rhodospirillum rubrum F11]MBK5956008.1 hypothetical protein [Rhodospirillum rubrum]QXG80217.1 hypothetical protein KUL73_18045 [Rhodospirillum rubrum]HAP99060.1 hypothetical protein [Rhodospirillum rubrum]